MPALPTITVTDLVRFRPCYEGVDRDKLLYFASQKPFWNALDILETNYPHDDQVWLMMRPEVLPIPLIQTILGRCAESLFELYSEKGQQVHPLLQQGLDVKRKMIASGWLDKPRPGEEQEALKALSYARLVRHDVPLYRMFLFVKLFLAFGPSSNTSELYTIHNAFITAYDGIFYYVRDRWPTSLELDSASQKIFRECIQQYVETE